MLTHIDLTFVVQIILFLLFFALLNRIFYRPLARIFRRRAEEIEAGQRAAEEAQRRAEETQREIQRQLDAARVEAQGIIAAATRDAAEQRQRLMAQARGEADTLVQQAQETIRGERETAVEDLRRQAAPLAVLVASKVVGKPLDTPENREVADRTVAELGGMQ